VSLLCFSISLIGEQHRLTPLTKNHGDEPCPKALLPIGNQPMLYYPLSWLEASGIKGKPAFASSPVASIEYNLDVLLICPAVQRGAVTHYIRSDASTAAFPSLRIDLQVNGDMQDLKMGTCAVLRNFAHKIKQDFIIVPCDFVPSPSLPLARVLDKFRTEVASDGSIATACFFEWIKPEKGGSTEEWNSLPTPMPIVWDESSGTLLQIDTPDDVDRDEAQLELSMGLLSRYIELVPSQPIANWNHQLS
jgi:translation initiation factor eIF-2B subunit gamma